VKSGETIARRLVVRLIFVITYIYDSCCVFG